MINAIKVNLVKLLESLGLADLPGSERKQFANMLALLKEPDTSIPPQHQMEISLFLTTVFCGHPKLMTEFNKRLVEAYSDKHLKSTKPSLKPGSKNK